MKSSIAVIGGGVAGLAAAVALHKRGVHADVYERAPEPRTEGMALVLAPNGLAALADIGLLDHVRAAGTVVRRVIERVPDGRIRRATRIPEHVVLFRRRLIESLAEALPDGALHMGKELLGFREDRGLRSRVRFTDGTDADAELFIAADGIHSRVREELFPHRAFSPVRVKALTCLIRDRDLAAELAGTMLKTFAPEGGLSIAVVGVGEEHILWYVQFDCSRWDPDLSTPERREAFARWLAGGWPHPIPFLIARTDFGSAHTWVTTDMDLLPSFHDENVLLIGDAGHPLLAISSQGANTALEDSSVLARCQPGRALRGQARAVCRDFDRRRRMVVQRHIDAGRDKLARFLSGERALATTSVG